MGISKAMMEKLVVAKSRGLAIPTMCCVRYGNVMASSGSVIPLFFEQIKRGENITITDPKMTRFLMSLDDAVNLVLYAFRNGSPGEIYVQKSPGATMHDLALAIMDLLNAKTGIKYIGSRHGQKLHETLVTREERVKLMKEKNTLLLSQIIEI